MPRRREIAIVKNTSEGIATVATGIDWKPGDDRRRLRRRSFPPISIPWQSARNRTESKSAGSPFSTILNRIDEAAKGARLLAISYVQLSERLPRQPGRHRRRFAHRNGCFFLSMPSRGWARFPSTSKRPISTHWQPMAISGCSARKAAASSMFARSGNYQIEPIEIGWTNFANYADYASRDMTFRSDAGRYECGTMNTIGCFGLRRPSTCCWRSESTRWASRF